MAKSNQRVHAAQTLSAAATGAVPNVDLDEARVAVRQAQTALAALGYDTGDIGGALDGVWGTETQQAVLAFQTDRGLARSGQLDRATLGAILDAENDAMEVESAAVPDEDSAREAAEALFHSADRESVNDVLAAIEPTDNEDDALN